jgi:hypothetical protein
MNAAMLSMIEYITMNSRVVDCECEVVVVSFLYSLALSSSLLSILDSIVVPVSKRRSNPKRQPPFISPNPVVAPLDEYSTMTEPPVEEIDPSEVRLVDRKLTDAETDAIRALVTSLLRRESVPQMFEEEDISDIAAYCIAMLSNEKTIAYVVEELAVFFADTDPSLGPELGQQLQQYLLEHVLTSQPEKGSSGSPGNALTMSGALEASRESKSRHKQAFERLTSSSERRGDARGGRSAMRGGGRGDGPRGRGRGDVRGGRGEHPPRGGRTDYRGDPHRGEKPRGVRSEYRGEDYPRKERHEHTHGGRGDDRREDHPRGGRGRGTPRFDGRHPSVSGHRRAREDEYTEDTRPSGRIGGRGEWSREEHVSLGRGELGGGRDDVPPYGRGRSGGRGDRVGRTGERSGGRGDRPGRSSGGSFASPSEGAPEAKRMRRHAEDEPNREEEYQDQHQPSRGYDAVEYEESGDVYEEYHQADGYYGNKYDEHYYPKYAPRGRGRGRSFYRARGSGRGRFPVEDHAAPHPSPIVAASYRGGRGGRAQVVKSMIASKTWVRNKPDAGDSAAPANEGGE